MGEMRYPCDCTYCRPYNLKNMRTTMKKFTVGKSYIHVKMKIPHICIYVSNSNFVVLREKDHPDFTLYQSEYHNWIEYKEPLKAIPVYIGVYKDKRVNKLVFGKSTPYKKENIPKTLFQGELILVDIVTINYEEKIGE